MNDEGIKKVICDGCKSEFDVDAVEIYELPMVLKCKEVTLLFFVCPSCYKLYRVGLQDAKFRELRDDLEKMKKRINKFRSKKTCDIAMAEKFDSMVRIKQARLKSYSDKLNKMYPGTFTFAASENNSNGVQVVYHENVE